MKLSYVILALAIFSGPGKISEINTLKSEAKEAFKAGDYKTAITKYRYLVDSLDVHEDEVLMNLGNAYFQLKDTTNAFNSYLTVAESKDSRIRSLSNQQLGVLANRQGKFEDALGYFKQAIRAAPTNEDARFNYEMVKKKVEEKKKQDEKNNKDKSQEPSAFAKKLKAQADQLVLQKSYRQAHELMNDGLKKDPTVSYYQEFIDRTKIVGGIAK